MGILGAIRTYAQHDVGRIARRGALVSVNLLRYLINSLTTLRSRLILNCLDCPEMMDEIEQERYLRAAFTCTCTPFKARSDLTTAVHESRYPR